MRNYMHLIAAIATLIFANKTKAEDSIADIYLNKPFWENMDWAKAESSRLWVSSGWSAYDDKRDTDAGFVKQRKVSILQNEFRASLISEHSLLKYPHSTSLFGKATKKQCEEYANLFSQKFGVPLTNEATMTILKISTYMMEYQWDIGQTRINAGCTGTENQDNQGSDSQDYIWAMKFSHKSLSEKMTQKFALRCSQRIEKVGSADPARDIDDMVFWVNPYTKALTTVTLFPIGDDIEIADDSIRFKIDTTHTSTKYRIDRITGGLSADIYVQGRLGARLTGSCEKTAATQAKF